MKMQVFSNITEAMQYIITNKLAANLATIESILLDKSVIKINDTHIFIDEYHLIH